MEGGGDNKREREGEGERETERESLVGRDRMRE